jgi:CubicO group peptidase (beta-lactamase class C family)|tara:strand:- start:53 stop:316 length:264 start_codon:yes stop_codon:yes gene_type:complete
MRWGSITKTFTALALGELVREDHLDRHTRVPSILPEIPHINRWRETDPVLLIHLAKLSAGFTDLGPQAWSVDAPMPLSRATHLDPSW